MPPEQLQPSPPGLDFSSADVQRASITPEDAGRIILQYAQQGMQADPAALLAMLVKAQVPGVVRYNVFPYRLNTTAGAIPSMQQILAENPLRRALVWFVSLAGSRAFLLFEPGPLAETLISDDTFTQKSNYAINDGNIQRPIFFLPPPSNAVTIMQEALTTTVGILFEGV